MASEVEKKEEIVYKADPFAFVFRELDLMHNEIREVKVELRQGLMLPINELMIYTNSLLQ